MNSRKLAIVLGFSCVVSGTMFGKSFFERIHVLWDDMRVAVSRASISYTTIEFVAEECTNLGQTWRSAPVKLGSAGEWARDNATNLKEAGRLLRSYSGKGRVSYEDLDRVLDLLEKVLVECPRPIWKWLEGNVVDRSTATDRVAYRAMLDMLRKERDKLNLEYRIALERRREV